MITDSYSEMIPEMGVRSVLGRGISNDYNEELGRLLRERATELETSDREREISLLRSGSAPPIVQGSLGASFFNGNGGADVPVEEVKSDLAYNSYYNLDRRLPSPLDMHSTRYVQGTSGTRGGSTIGDRRKLNRIGSVNGGGRGGGGESLFAMQPEFGGSNEENTMQAKEWSGNGLIGLPGLGLVQDDMGDPATVSRHPSRPESCLFEDDKFTGSHATLHHDFTSFGALHSSTNMQGVSSLHSISSSIPQTMGASLSRNITPDPQVFRSPSPCLSDLSGTRASSLDRRHLNVPKLYDAVSSDIAESADLVASLSGLSLSGSSLVDERKTPTPLMHDEIDTRHNLFHLQRNKIPIKQLPFFNETLKGPSSPTLNNRVSSPSHYHNIGSPTSSLSNYGVGGFPASPLALGKQVAAGNIPPLVENGPPATALGPSGIDARAFHGGLGFELENFASTGNYSSVDPLPIAFTDPSYLQYQRSNGYFAAGLNGQRIHQESLANSPGELLALQKAYFDALLQKSQYGMGFGKPSILSNGFHRNFAFGRGCPYPGNWIGPQKFPNSPIISDGPLRNVEHIMHYPSDLRNIAGNFMGPWPSESGCNLEETFASSLLDEFKGNKTRCFELAEIAGHVVEFSADQYGSRFIQQKLETASTQEKDMVFHEIMPQALSLMTDVFGNYVIQKFFEHGSPSQIRQLAEQLIGHVLTLSLQMYGCRVIQKALEVIELDQQTNMVAELDGHVMRCVRDQNGNHVIQKCIECVPESAIQFIVTTFYDQVVTLSTHPYGCRVIQRVLEHCYSPKTQSIMMSEILQSVCMLAQDQYGNYVIQHVLEHGKPHERSAIISQLIGKIVEMSQQKFASNVIEKCLSFGTPEERQGIVHEMLGSTDDNEPLQVMMKDQFANYVVQKVLETCDDQQLEVLLIRIKDHLNALKKYTYGKHIVARVEKLVAAGERRISILASSST